MSEKDDSVYQAKTYSGRAVPETCNRRPIELTHTIKVELVSIESLYVFQNSRRLEWFARIQVLRTAIDLAVNRRILSVTSAIVKGRETQAILHFLREQKADLLVIGLHQHDFCVSRLWSSVYNVAQDAPCSVLGVH